MRSRYLLRAICLLALLVSIIPAGNVSALVPSAVPPVDMFQLPWEQGLAWVAIDGLDNGTKRPLTSSHHFSVGGAIDFAPHNNMVKGENTSTFWTAAAAAGTVVGTSSCHVILDHGNGWVTQYQFLANVQVQLGDAVSRNQRLGIIADGVRQKFCPGSTEPNVPHLHFMLRPTMRNATFAGWQVNYLPVLNKTTFTKNGETLGLFKPLLNVMDSPATPTPTATTQPTNTPTASTTIPSPTATSTMPSGPFVLTQVNPTSINIDENALVTVNINNLPPNEYTSAEFTCTYDKNLVEASNITVASLFGTDPVTAINGPQNGSFIVAIAGSNDNKATASGTAFTFEMTGLQAGQTSIVCRARVSPGNNTLTEIPFVADYLTILGSTPTVDLTPSVTPTLTLPPTSATPTIPATACDKAQFFADVTIPSGTVMAPGTTFTKTWRLKNVGTCDWTTSYQLVFFSGEQMGGVSSANFTQTVAVGQTADFSINLTAPNEPGSYRGYWMFKNADGALFGIGAQANHPWWVDIRVSDSTVTPGAPSQSPTPTVPFGGASQTPSPAITPDGPTVTPISGVAYDFAANACAATWFSGAGQLPCPGIDGDPKGFVLKLNNPVLETGVTDTRPGLLTFPQNVQNGYIQGFYPPFHVQNGDRFRSTLSCEFGATSCYVAYRLDYQTENDVIRTLRFFLERYEGQSFSLDVDLSALAGQDVKFILTVLANGPATGDRAMWVGPHIYRAGAVSTTVPSATPTNDWLTFTNSTYGFEFKYPPQGVIADGRTDNFARIDLPFVQGTNLQEKYLEVTVTENATTCKSPLGSQNSETITINDIQFLKETAQDSGVGHLRQWVAYSTERDNVCVSLGFILHSLNAGNFPTPPPEFDFSAESAVFGQMVETFTWLAQTPTATPGFETPLPVGSLTPTVTATPTVTVTGTPMSEAGLIVGEVFASKLVRIEAFDVDNNLVGAAWVNTNGTFEFHAASGTNSVIASAGGFLSAQLSVTITDGSTTTLPTITLIAGDIDNNNVIDQFDAMTIGINYNTANPGEADLNNDGIINVLDLELLAENYRKTGPVAWE